MDQIPPSSLEASLQEKLSFVEKEPQKSFPLQDEYAPYPVKIATNSTLGRYLVAIRDIPAGTVLLRDSPIFMSPNAGEGTCLGCCLKVKKPVQCSKCEWPV
jgi:hypothetical protein